MDKKRNQVDATSKMEEGMTRMDMKNAKNPEERAAGKAEEAKTRNEIEKVIDQGEGKEKDEAVRERQEKEEELEEAQEKRDDLNQENLHANFREKVSQASIVILFFWSCQI